MAKDRIALILAKMKGKGGEEEHKEDGYDSEDESGLSAAGDELKSALENVTLKDDDGDACGMVKE